MLQDMANYIKQLTDENEKLKEEKEIIEKENKRLRQGWEYWRKNYYHLLQTSGETDKERIKFRWEANYWKEKYFKEYMEKEEE